MYTSLSSSSDLARFRGGDDHAEVGAGREHFFDPAAGAVHRDADRINHVQGTHLLTAWTRAECPSGTTVEEELGVKAAHDIDRRPDVLVTFPDGRRWALEVEYRSLTLVEWLEKDAAYRESGTETIWCWGHTRWLPRLPAVTGGGIDPRFSWRDLTRAVASSGRPVLFVNPGEQMIAVAYTPGPPPPIDPLSGGSGSHAVNGTRWWDNMAHFGDSLTRVTTPPRSYPQIAVHTLDECRFDAELGLVTPTHEAIASERSRVAALAETARAEAAAVS